LPLARPVTKSKLMALTSVPPAVARSKPKKLLDQTRDVLRLKHYSVRTERSYCDWIKRARDRGEESTRLMIVISSIGVDAALRDYSYVAVTD
jgi:hypothetical protein